MVCSRCSSLPITRPSIPKHHWSLWSVQHHSTFAELDQSVQNGCQVCAPLRTVLLEYYAHGRSCSVEEAERYHRQLDQHDESRGNELSDSEESASESQDSWRYSRRFAFYVQGVSWETASDSQPPSHGLQGLLYMRIDKGPDSIDRIYPFIEVSSLPDSIALREWHVIGRQATATPDMSLAKRWLDDCSASHPDCPKSLISRLPSRILDLKPSDGTSDLRLWVDVKSYGCYATLSHCWGESQPLRLMRATYDEFQIRIEYKSLPKTFQDAVTATRLLGLRYLWIDSLCIIQDSKPDWEEQCAEMRRIYKDSFVTLAAAAASGCESGFLHDRPILHGTTIEPSDGRSSCRLVLSHYGVDEDPFYPLPEPNSPLSRRAWALQERLLSGRVLYFGTKKMYLECFTNIQYDDCHYPVKWIFESVLTVLKSPIDQLGSQSKCFEYWTSLVATYSSLGLTKITDRLPALSGLAADFQSATGAKYLAGVWHEDMPRALTWYISPWKKSTAVSSSTSSSYLAPSWSWAVAKSGVTFAMRSYEDEFYSDFEIIAAEATLASCDPFGAVTGGFIDASCRIRHHLVEEWPHIEQGTFCIKSANPDISMLGFYFPDDASKVENHEFGIWLLYLGRYSVDQAVALAVKPVGDERDTYERIGLAFAGFLDHEDAPGLVASFQGVAKRRVRLI